MTGSSDSPWLVMGELMIMCFVLWWFSHFHFKEHDLCNGYNRSLTLLSYYVSLCLPAPTLLLLLYFLSSGESFSPPASYGLAFSFLGPGMTVTPKKHSSQPGSSSYSDTRPRLVKQGFMESAPWWFSLSQDSVAAEISLNPFLFILPFWFSCCTWHHIEWIRSA